MTKRMTVPAAVLLLTTFGRPSAARGAEGATLQFPQGTKSFALTSSYILPARFSEDHLLDVEVAGGYFLWDNHALHIELQGYWADQDFDSDVYIGGIGILGRWHLLRGHRWSFFIDGGGGVTYADQEFPQHPYDGTNFNFTGKVGVGATYEVSDGAHLMGGVRYFHLSNGNYRNRDDNPTYDGMQLWGGMMWTW